jgi:hypothetical protein
MRRIGKLILLAFILLLCFIAFRIGCGGKKQARVVPEPIQHVSLDTKDRHDLERDEALGGHTLDRHVGRSEKELRDRLDNESISAASAYTDRATAEMAVAAAIHENSRRIDSWLHRPGGHSNLVLDYDSSVPLGQTLRRSDAQSFPCSHAVVILKWVNADRYYVLTSYPECWKRQ